MKIAVVNGPNMNMLGIREPELYGTETYETLCNKISAYAEKKGITVAFFQSNHEGALIDCLQDCFGNTDGIVLNAAAYTHTSVALLDTLQAIRIPTVEVHLTDTNAREPFRRVSLIRPACIETIQGRGTQGYLDALDVLEAYLTRR